MSMQQKNMQSTKMTADLPLTTPLDFSPSQEPQNNCTYAIFTTILPATKLEKLNHDQKGKFLVQQSCSCGYNYALWYSTTTTAMPSSPSLSKLAKPVS
jgi:outer membrane receptor for monomeric catechols